MEFRNYKDTDYNAVCTFLQKLNETDKSHINWNWARFEWMYAHPEFDKSAIDKIGLWWEKDEIVAAAIYDMYFGEGFCGVLEGYEKLYPEVLTYAYEELKDDGGFGFAIPDTNTNEVQMATEMGFHIADQEENMMCISLEQRLSYELPEELQVKSFHPANEAKQFQWLLWQGFDHGTDYAEFEENEEIIPQIRPNLKQDLSIAILNEKKEIVAYACVWYDNKTDYAYVEPVCTIPAYRGKGLARAALYEALNRARKLGAKSAYVISDMEFYQKLGFKNASHNTFYWKE